MRAVGWTERTGRTIHASGAPGSGAVGVRPLRREPCHGRGHPAMHHARIPLRLSAALLLAAVLGACSDRDPVGPSLREPGAPVRDVGIQAFTGSIRIGVVPAATSVVIGSAAD